jgi:acetylornithine deacetylase/succinyl-diaminopimelate desuccinylase-like protein
MSNVVQLLGELVALPSVNPAFLPGRPEFTGERRVAEFLASTTASAGLDVELRDVTPGRPNLFIQLTPAGRVTKRVVLAPHLDTVGGHEVPGKLFTPQLRNGRLHGRGSCDTKGSVATFLSVLSALAKSGRRPANTEILFVGLMDEEKNQTGSRALVRGGFKADLAIVGEPTRLQVVTTHKGVLWLELETRGKAAHGARPELGKNAVLEMARVVEILQTTYARELRQRQHRILGHPTINVGEIRGGQQANIVPDRCRIKIDRRTLPGETDAVVKRGMLSLLRRHGLSARFVGPPLEPSWPMETDPRHPLVAAFFRSARQGKPAGVHYFSDAGVLAHGGIPSVLFGPGDIAQAHTADEWIAVSQLERAARLLERFLRELP